jgi:pyruvate formate lyase activating enzyme
MDTNLANNYKARFFHVHSDDKIMCDLCPRHCVIGKGQHGFCLVRQNHDNQMVLTTYGRSSGFCIDPIEKKPLNHFYPGQPILSFGTAGCNLGCRFCQNWDISKAKELDKLQQTATPAHIAAVCKQLNCVGVAFTYNDPVIFAEYAIDIAYECKKLGLKTVAVTAGYITDTARSEFYSVMDAANVDLKAFTQTFYKRLCMANLEPILDTLVYLKHETSVWFEITNLIIPTHNDDLKEIDEMTRWIYKNLGSDVPIHFTGFHPDFKMMDLNPTSAEILITAHKIAKDNGLNYVYTGNIHHAKTASTYCPNCNECLIQRDWYELGEYHIKDNKCMFCDTYLAGVFPNSKGTWGRKRLPVSI